MGEGRSVYRVLVEKHEEKRQLGRPRIILRRIFRKWDVGGMDWFELVQDTDRWRALVNALINLLVP
jgi:hypothetical protein